jgi:predicted dehydrogenase
MEKVKVGVVGCGNISSIYLKNMTQMFDSLAVKAVVDVLRPRAEKAATDFGIPVIYDTAEQMLADGEIELILNLTTPPSHAAICLAALQAGKNVYVEKPLAVSREDGQKIVELAKKKGLLVGGAPDTFLGAGLQTCRKLIDDGVIGEPVACSAFMACHGHEHWHPDPAFYYKEGAGPMMDMGPYYITALVSLMGPVESVSAFTRITFPKRTITSEKKYGQIIDVEVPTHVAGVMNFASGAIGSVVMSFDVWAAELPRIEIYGSLGSLSVPDPNTFGGPVRYFKPGMQAWQEAPLAFNYAENSRGLGIADMAMALRMGRRPRAGSPLTYHVLDVMQAFEDSCREGLVYRLGSVCGRPEPMNSALLEGQLD